MPLYETALDRENQRLVLQAVADFAGCTVHMTETTDRVDGLFSRDCRLCAVCECKVRWNPRTHFRTYYVDASKLRALRERAAVLGVPGWLIVCWEDAIGFLSAEEMPDFVQLGGRVDRGDPLDIDEVAHFRIERFRLPPVPRPAVRRAECG